MTVARFILLIVVIFGVGAKAETILVTSGEHDGFTRIVLKVPEALAWALSVENDVASILFEQRVTVDDSNVFDRISRETVQSTNVNVVDGGSAFNISLNCDCKVTAVRYLSEYIVVDIANPSDVEDAQVEITHHSPQLGLPADSDWVAAAPTAVSWVPPQAPHYTEAAHTVNFPQTAPAIEALGMTVFELPDALPFSAHVDAESNERLIQSAVTAEINEIVTAARTSLLEQLTLAAEQGLLEFTGIELSDSEISENDTETQADPAPIPKTDPPRDVRQWNIQSVYDRDATLANFGTGELDKSCPNRESVNVALWRGGGSFSTEISEIRRRLIGEFDEPNYDAVLDMVRLYLRYGFGAEALMYLQEFEGDVPDYSILTDLAFIVDGRQITPDGPLFGAVGCGGVVSIWALAGMYPSVSGDIRDVEDVLVAFADMPIDLREMLGARLMMSLVDRGFVDVSAQISDILARAPGEHGSQYELSLATVLQEKDSTEEAREILSDLAGRNDDVSAEALAILAESLLEDGQKISEKMQLDIGSAANEARGTELGIELRRLEALIVAQEQGGAEALELISSEIQKTPSNSDVLRRTALDLLKDMSPERDDSQEYLQAIVNYRGYIDAGVAGDGLRLEIGKELLEYGFPSLALEFLLPLANSADFQASMVTAKAYLSVMDAESAISVLSELEGDRVRQMRVEAFLMSEDFEQALAEVLSITDPDMQIIEYGWYSGDWRGVAQTNAAAAILWSQYINNVAPAQDDGDTITGPQVVSKPLVLSEVQDVLTQSQDVSLALLSEIQD